MPLARAILQEVDDLEAQGNLTTRNDPLGEENGDLFED